MAPKLEKLVGNFELGSSPFWDQEAQVLYFVDVTGHTIHRWDPKTKKHTSADVGHNVSVIIPVQGKKDQFVISLDSQLVLVQWDGVSDKVSKTETLLEVDQDQHEHVLNDGKCDPTGRLWIGTMAGLARHVDNIPPEQGTLYYIPSLRNKTVQSMEAHVPHAGYSNGLAFNRTTKKMYYVDAKHSTINEYDYDMQTGQISNQKVIFTASKHHLDNVVLDDMTIDTDGHLYVAVWDSKIIKIDPQHPETLMETIQLPAKVISSVTWGGQNMDELYVTTGQMGITPGAADGATYKLTGLNARGYGETKIVL